METPRSLSSSSVTSAMSSTMMPSASSLSLYSVSSAAARNASTLAIGTISAPFPESFSIAQLTDDSTSPSPAPGRRQQLESASQRASLADSTENPIGARTFHPDARQQHSCKQHTKDHHLPATARLRPLQPPSSRVRCVRATGHSAQPAPSAPGIINLLSIKGRTRGRHQQWQAVRSHT